MRAWRYGAFVAIASLTGASQNAEAYPVQLLSQLIGTVSSGTDGLGLFNGTGSSFVGSTVYLTTFLDFMPIGSVSNPLGALQGGYIQLGFYDKNKGIAAYSENFISTLTVNLNIPDGHVDLTSAGYEPLNGYQVASTFSADFQNYDDQIIGRYRTQSLLDIVSGTASFAFSDGVATTSGTFTPVTHNSVVTVVSLGVVSLPKTLPLFGSSLLGVAVFGAMKKRSGSRSVKR